MATRTRVIKYLLTAFSRAGSYKLQYILLGVWLGARAGESRLVQAYARMYKRTSVIITCTCGRIIMRMLRARVGILVDQEVSILLRIPPPDI